MNTNMKQRAAMISALALAFCVPAVAQTLYKLIDKNGKVTYSETAPQSFDGQVIRIDIDPNANTMTMPKAPVAKDGARGGEPPKARVQKSSDGKTTKAELDPELAKERLEAARSALAEARDNPREGEVTFIGKVGGGSRPVLSEDYVQRLERLEAAVKAAEEELKRAEGR
jgi:hypothetical protein